MFVTHSTSDQQWAREIVHGLSGKWKVKACYQLMPNPRSYNDGEIRNCMRQSCVIFIGLSPAYMQSKRCVLLVVYVQYFRYRLQNLLGCINVILYLHHLDYGLCQ